MRSHQAVLVTLLLLHSINCCPVDHIKCYKKDWEKNQGKAVQGISSIPHFLTNKGMGDGKLNQHHEDEKHAHNHPVIQVANIADLENDKRHLNLYAT